MRASIASGLVLAGLLTVGGCGTTPDPRTAMSANGLYEVTYLPSPLPIPFSELFALDVHAKDAKGAVVAGATVTVKVTMPSHGHGMQTSPTVSERAGGDYHVDGMKFHMHGVWKIVVTVDGPAGTDAATFDEDYQP
jgi:hypothetical protein